MQVSLSTQIVKPESVLKIALDDETLFLNTQTETYVGLDDIGSRMFEVLIGSASVGAAKQRLLEEYDVSPETLEQELFELIGKLLEQGLVEAGSAPDG